MTALTLANANRIIEATLAKGAEMGLNPLGVAVLDAGGHVVSMQRQDGSPFMRVEIAAGKAHGALGFGAGSRKLNTISVERPHFGSAYVALTGGRAVPVPGGVLIRTGSGEIIGAVGVSGDTSDNDEAAASAGIEAAGFKADGG